jgi:hypothetical protein
MLSSAPISGRHAPRSEDARAQEPPFSSKLKTGMSPNADFEHFVRDYLQLARQERSPELRSRLIRLAREWMQAAARKTDCPTTRAIRKFRAR